MYVDGELSEYLKSQKKSRRSSSPQIRTTLWTSYWVLNASEEERIRSIDTSDESMSITRLPPLRRSRSILEEVRSYHPIIKYTIIRFNLWLLEALFRVSYMNEQLCTELHTQTLDRLSKSTYLRHKLVTYRVGPQDLRPSVGTPRLRQF